MNKRAVGSEKETKAAEYLKARGVKILESNYSCRAGEVDLIGEDHGCLVFFEVKWRRSGYSGDPSEAVDRRKQQKICRVCDNYRMFHTEVYKMQVRFDVLAMEEEEVNWIKNAFDYVGRGF